MGANYLSFINNQARIHSDFFDNVNYREQMIRLYVTNFKRRNKNICRKKRKKTVLLLPSNMNH